MKIMFIAERRRAPARWFALAALVIVADQLSKQLVLHTLPLGQAQALTGWFNLLHLENPGAAFSFLAAAGGWQRWLFTAFSLGAAVLLTVLLTRSRRTLLSAALALILGGALGNALDRLRSGHVTDFLDLHLWVAGQDWHWPAFNLADSAIFVGAALLLWSEWRQR